jgi:hypothetical protein
VFGRGVSRPRCFDYPYLPMRCDANAIGGAIIPLSRMRIPVPT